MLSFQETDGSGPCSFGMFCAGGVINQQDVVLGNAAVGGTPGQAEYQMTIDPSAVDHRAIMMACLVPDGVQWAAGTWTVKLRVLRGNSDITLESVYLCRIDANCVSQGLIGKAIGLGLSMGSAGVHTVTIDGAAQTPNPGDNVMMVIGFSNSAGRLKSFYFIKDQTIDSPFV